MMDESPDVAARVLVIARPALGRKIEMALRMAGHEVYRTPDPSATESLVARLRPRIVIVALDLPWGDAEGAVARLCSSRHALPVIVLGESYGDGLEFAQMHLPLEADAIDVQEAVAALLASPSIMAA
jgi:hypothetical protein